MENMPKFLKNPESAQAALDNGIRDARAALQAELVRKTAAEEMLAAVKEEAEEASEEDKPGREDLIRQLGADLKNIESKIAANEGSLQNLYTSKMELIDPSTEPN